MAMTLTLNDYLLNDSTSKFFARAIFVENKEKML